MRIDLENVHAELPDNTNNGRQLALCFMVNTLWDYAQKHGLKFPELPYQPNEEKPNNQV